MGAARLVFYRFRTIVAQNSSTQSRASGRGKLAACDVIPTSANKTLLDGFSGSPARSGAQVGRLAGQAPQRSPAGLKKPPEAAT